MTTRVRLGAAARGTPRVPPAGGGTGGTGGVAVAAGTQTASTGTVLFANSNGLTFGMSASSRVTGNYAAPRALSAAGNSITDGTFSFGNANNITFGMAGSTLTASANAGTGNLGAISASGNSVSNGTVVFSNANNISFGMAGSTVTGSVSAGTGNFGAISASGNSVSAGTVVFSNANSVSFGMAGSTVTASISAGTGNFGAISASGNSVSAGTVVFSNSNNVSFGMAGSTVTASFSQTVPLSELFDNMELGGTGTLGGLVTWNANIFSSLKIAPMHAAAFPYNITANTLMFDLSLSANTSNDSSAFTYSISVGIYTSTGGTLSLLNSGLATFGFTANANNTQSYSGQRFLTMVASQWSSSPVFARGSKYYIGTVLSSAGISMTSMNQYGIFLFSTGSSNTAGARLGTIGLVSASNASMGFNPFYGLYTANTGAMPAAIPFSDLNKSGLGQRAFVPHIIMVNNTGVSSF